VGTVRLDRILIIFLPFVFFQILFFSSSFGQSINDVPPLERLPITNERLVNAFDEPLEITPVDSVVMVSADLPNGLDEEQYFVYVVQIMDEENLVVHLTWITGSIFPEQTLSTASSWLPTKPGHYSAHLFVWSSFNSPTALSLSKEIPFQVI